jgi:MOSC domain-containing protein YiiM
MSDPVVISINISKGGIPKLPVDRVQVIVDGLVGDEHDHECHRTPKQAVCLLDVERIDELRGEGYAFYPGAAGENLTVRGLDAQALPVGTRLTFSGGLEIEITKIRKPCFVLDSIDPKLKKTAVGRIGTYAKVITPAMVTTGETIAVQMPVEIL